MAATITPDEERRLFALDIGFTKKAIRTLTRYDVDHFLAGCPGDPEPDGPAIAAPLPHIPAQAAVDDTPPSAPIHLREQIEHVMELQNGGTTKPSKHDDIAGDAGNGNAAPAGIASSPPPSTPNRDVQKNGAETSFGAPPPPKGDEPTTHKTGDDPGAAGTDYPGPDADNAALIRDPAVNKALPGTPEPDDAVTAPPPANHGSNGTAVPGGVETISSQCHRDDEPALEPKRGRKRDANDVHCEDAGDAVREMADGPTTFEPRSEQHDPGDTTFNGEDHAGDARPELSEPEADDDPDAAGNGFDATGTDDPGPDAADAAPIRDPAVNKALDAAIIALRKADGELAKLRAISDGAEAIEALDPFGDREPIDHLSDMAIHVYGLDAHLVQIALANGAERARKRREENPAGEQDFSARPNGADRPRDHAKSGTTFNGEDDAGDARKERQDGSTKNSSKPFTFDPKPYAFPDPASIPPRQWLYGRHYLRGIVSASLGAPGRLKSTTSLTEIIGMAAGRDLLTGEPLECGRLRVAYLNGEENQDELDRRVAAICQHYGVKSEDCGDRLFVVSTRDNPVRFAIPGQKGAAVVAKDVVDAMLAWCEARNIDVLTVDPLISFHAVRENDSGDMDLLCKEAFGTIAGKNRAVDLVVHPSKCAPGEINTTVDDMRGSSAQLAAVRTARTFNFMTAAEAAQLGIDEDQRRLHVRIENGKGGPGPLGNANWVKIKVETLPNRDDVAVAIAWKPPDPFQNVTTKDMELARELARTGAYRADNRSPDWFGWKLAEHLKIPILYGGANSKPDMARIKAIIKKWLATGVLDIDKREDEGRKKRQYIIAGSFQSEPRSTSVPAERDDE
jgi:hypothetical protein